MPPAAGRPWWNMGYEQGGVKVFFTGGCCRGGLDDPVLDVGSRGVSHGIGGVAEDWSMEEKIRHTPTWCAKCWI